MIQNCTIILLYKWNKIPKHFGLSIHPSRNLLFLLPHPDLDLFAAHDI